MKHILTPRLADLQILYTTKPHARKSLAKRFSRAAPGLTPTPNRPQDAICRMVLPHIPHPLPPILSFHPLSPPLATRSKVLYLVPIHCLLHPPHINRRPYPSPRFQTARPELHLHTREAQRTSQNGNVRICTTSIVPDAVIVPDCVCCAYYEMERRDGVLAPGLACAMEFSGCWRTYIFWSGVPVWVACEGSGGRRYVAE
jgi:hypothetical protein